MRDNSQCGESRWIVDNLTLPPVGTFVEVGAFDGIQSSNTLLFEDLGWTGILVEADPFLAAQSQKNRKNPTLCCAVALNWGIDKFPINDDDRGLSGFKRPGKYILLPIMPLKPIVMACDTCNCDLLSIDTEGTELEVWESIGDFRPSIVIMEYQTCDLPPNDKAIVEQMTKDGYKEVHRTQYNLIFTKV